MIKKIILSWLFGYYQPQYFHARIFYKNIKWEVKQFPDGYCKSFLFNGFDICEERRTWDNTLKWSVVEKINDKTRRVHMVEDFSGFILYLHDILHCGIIMPETIEKYGNVRTYPI